MFEYFAKCLQLIVRENKPIFKEELELPDNKFFKVRLFIYRFLPSLVLVLLLSFDEKLLAPFGIENPYSTIIVGMAITVNVVLLSTLILMFDIKLEKTIRGMFAAEE